MSKEKLSKLRFWAANMDFALGTLFLLEYTAVLPVPPRLSPTVFLVLTLMSYTSAVVGLFYYVRGK